MTPTDLTVETLLEALRVVTATLEASRAEAAALREEAAKQREESRAENARLYAMVQGLTKHLDVLLKSRDEERRAELAKLLEV